MIFINRFYWPDDSATSQLLTDLAEHISLNGTKVTIITSRLRYASSKERLPTKGRHNGVEICRVWTTGFDRKSLAGRAVDFLTFYIFATFALIRLVQRNDIVVAKTDPPLIQVFAWLATWIKQGRLVNWCQDLFPELIYGVAQKEKGMVLSTALHRLRNFALRRSYVNVTISNEMGKTLAIQGLDKKRIQVIRNWCDPAIMPIASRTNALRKRWQLEDYFVLGYSGNLGRAHLPDMVHLLVDELADIAELRFLFIGSGHGMTWLRQQCQRQGHKHVIFKPYQPRETLSLSLSVPDLHLISLRSGCQNFIAPSKYYGILAAGRPVAFLGDSDCEMAEEVRESQLGITLAADRQETWRDQVLGLIKNKAELATMGNKARQTHETRFASRRSLDAWQRIIQPASQLQSSNNVESNLAGPLMPPSQRQARYFEQGSQP